MIPNTKRREVTSAGITASSEFGISRGDEAHLMTILRDTLYTDKVLAVLREYGANAWDSHRESGKADVPIKITLPTSMEPTLSIKDFGNGLSHEDVFQIYTQYGASTKRSNDVTVGCLGIGSKSGFSYSDSFNIIACHGGVRRTYVAVLDKSEKGTVNLLHEELCGNETGVEIKIPIRVEDINEFEEKALKIFQHFEPYPDINTEKVTQHEGRKLTHGIMYEERNSYGQGTWTAVMGCVPYRIDLNQLIGEQLPHGGIGFHVRSLSGVLYFDIGEVQISASREELKYTTPTRAAIISKINALVDEYIETVLNEIKGTNLTPWEKRLRAQILTKMELPIPNSFNDLVSGYVKLDRSSMFFNLLQDKLNVESIAVTERSRILVRDDKRTMKGYNLVSTDYIAVPRHNVGLDKTLLAINELLEANGLTGMTIQKMSEIEWFPTEDGRDLKKLKKHTVTTFRLLEDKAYSHPWSNAWEIVQREPTDDDVFVILNSFRTTGEDIYHSFIADSNLASAFDYLMPTVYGYKNTEKKPVDPNKINGTLYTTWRKKFIRELLTPTVTEMLSQYHLNKILFDEDDWRDNKCTPLRLEVLTEKLGKKHPIISLLEKQHEAQKFIKKLSTIQKHQLPILAERTKEIHKTNETETTLKELRKKYPILALHHIGFNGLWGTENELWVNYVKLVDNATK